MTKAHQVRFRKLYGSFIFGEKISMLSLPAEAFYWRCYSIADDFGNFPTRPDALIEKVAGLRTFLDVEVQGYVKEMEAAGLIRLYLVGEEDWYGHFLSFARMQDPTGPPSSPDFGRQRQYPESPWDAVKRVNQHGQNSLVEGFRLGVTPKRVTRGAKNNSYNSKEIAKVSNNFSPLEISNEEEEHIFLQNKKYMGEVVDRDFEQNELFADEVRNWGKSNKVKGVEKHNFVLAVFQYWQDKCNHPNAQLSPERVKLLELRFRDSSLEEVKRAIDGCASSDFHMGRQPNNPVKYDDLMLICRNRTKVEFFMNKVTDKAVKVVDRKKKAEEARSRYHGGN